MVRSEPMTQMPLLSTVQTIYHIYTAFFSWDSIIPLVADEYLCHAIKELLWTIFERACLAQAEGRQMLRNGGGKIINTASMAAVFVPHPQKQIAYNASKAAVVKITETLGVEWADRNIRVNCISPGIVNTALIQVILSFNSDFLSCIHCDRTVTKLFNQHIVSLLHTVC